MKKILTVLLLLSLTAISFGTIKSAGGGGSGYTLFTQFGQEGATAGQVLSWDGANWVPDTVSGSVTDTTVTSNYYASIVSINNNLVVSGNIIVNGGMVGIGTSTPSTKLDVVGDITLENDATIQNAGLGSIQLNGISNRTRLILNAPTNKQAELYLAATARSWTVINDGEGSYGNAGDFIIRDISSANNVLAIKGGTNFVGLGTTNPSYNLDVTGTINASAAVLVNGSPLTASGGGITTANADARYVSPNYWAGVSVNDTVSASAFSLGGSTITSWVAGSAMYRNLFAPDSMDFLIEDVPVSGSELLVVSGNTSIPCMLMDDTTTEGRKVVVYVPVGMTSIDWEFTGKSTVPTANDIDITLYSREISTNALMSAWETYDIGTWNLVLNDFMETKTATTALSALGWIAGRSYQLIVARGAARAGDTLIGDFQMVSIRMDIE